MHTPSTLASGGARTAPPPPPARRCTRSPASHASALAPKPRSSVAVAVARRSSVAPVAATAEIVSGPFCDLEVDTVLAKELAENGFRSTRRTKIICTIGPASSDAKTLGELATAGMNVARLNMCHGDHAWHKALIHRIRTLNKEKG